MEEIVITKLLKSKKYFSVIFIIAIFLIPGVFMLFNYSNKDELVFAITSLIVSIGLIWFTFNMDKAYVKNFICKWI